MKRVSIAQRSALFGLLLSSLTPAYANEAVSLCMEDADNVPWIMHGGKQGVVQILMAEVEKQSGVGVKLTAMPWKDCLAAVKAGKVDGAISASYNKERAEFADYPIKLDGEVDATRRSHRAAFSLYKPKGSALGWDGKVLSVNGVVGAQQGFSVVAQLKDLGAKVEDTTTSADEVLKRVAAGKYAAGVVNTTEGEASLADTAGLKDKLERVEPAFAEKAYYTIFSKVYTAKNQATARKVWNSMLAVRNDAGFKAKVASLTRGAE